MQNTEAFEAGTNGAIKLATENIMGDLQETSMLGEIANLIARRDISADSSLTAKTISSRDENNIKLYWGSGAVEFKLVDAKRYGSNTESFSAAIGEQIGKGIVSYLLNASITATRACIETVPALVTGDGTGTVSHLLLNSALKPFGDARENILCWIMKGATFTDLVGSGISAGGDVVSGGTIYQGTTGTLGKPAYVTDSDGLDMTTGVAVLGLTMDALIATETATREFLAEVVGGNDNLKFRIQTEGEFMLNVKGYSWKTASGVNPTVANLGTAANWEQKASDIKSTAGVILNVA
jgi:hypothetical protein